MKLNQEQRLVKAKISLLLQEPWFGQLSTYLNLIEKRKEEIPTAAINLRGDFFFNPEFIEKLNDDELKGLVCHEILHLAFQHPFRILARNPILWNIAADLKVNEEINSSGIFKLPKDGLIPNYQKEWEFAKIKIKNIDVKTTEQIYEELYSKVPKFEVKISFGQGQGSPQPGKGKEGQNGGGKVQKVDTSKLKEPWKGLVEKMIKDLIRSEKEDHDNINPSESKQLARDWEERVDAANQSGQGRVPAGILRELRALENPELPWYQIIRQRLSKLVRKKSWKFPNKKWLPFYFPGSEKRKTIKAVIAIDTSGSMSTHDITQAISETWGIANSFRNFQLFIVFNDADVWDKIEVKNGNREIIKHLRPKGGGGTDFRPVFDLIKKEWNDSIDCLVFFTDGYGNFPDKKPSYQVYWTTQSNDIVWPFGQVLHLKSSS